MDGLIMKIESVYYFDYTNNIGFYQSIRDFRSEEMTYISFAFSTPKIHVNATPDQFKIGANPSNKVREFVISHLEDLKKISQMLAENSPKYIMVCFADESKMYFEYNENFCEIFNLINENRPRNEKSSFEYENPYMVQKGPNPFANVNSMSSIAPQNSVPRTNTVTQKSNVKKTIPWKNFILPAIIGALVLFFVIVPLSQAISDMNKPDNDILSTVAEPISGTILSGREVYDESKITVTADDGDSCYVKLKDSYDVTVLSFYVRAGETVTVGVPYEPLYVCFARGDDWYGTKYLFGEKTVYSKDANICDFSEAPWRYELQPVSDGNLSLMPIDAEDF